MCKEFSINEVDANWTYQVNKNRIWYYFILVSCLTDYFIFAHFIIFIWKYLFLDVLRQICRVFCYWGSCGLNLLIRIFSLKVSVSWSIKTNHHLMRFMQLEVNKIYLTKDNLMIPITNGRHDNFNNSNRVLELSMFFFLPCCGRVEPIAMFIFL